MDIKKHQKTPTKIICKTCDFTCSRNSEYIRHVSTAKHTSQSQGYKKDIKKHQKNTETVFPCENCGKKYKFYSGLWRHKKLCNQTDLQINTETKKDDKELIILLVKQNTELIEVLKNGTHNTTNNTNSYNKTFNLQLFLNETCKDAMNITDFVETIKIQLHDLIKVGEIGYVEGISNIITTNLKALDVTQRPIHCTDKKRETLYVKEEDKWGKEDEEKTKLRKAIKSIANKNIKLLPEFKEKYPDCKESNSKFSEQYNKLLIESMGGFGKNTTEKEDTIIKNISKNVIIEKDEIN
jgi:hypothetical protein